MIYLKKWREFFGLTQEAVGDLWGIGKTAVSKKERIKGDVRGVDAVEIEKLAAFLGIHPGWLFHLPPDGAADEHKLMLSAPPPGSDHVPPPDAPGEPSGWPHVTLAELHLALATGKTEAAGRLAARLKAEIDRVRRGGPAREQIEGTAGEDQ